MLSRSNAVITVSPVILKKTELMSILKQIGKYFFLLYYYWCFCLLLVGDVAGVVDPHQLTETLTPPRGQMQSHVEAVFNLRRGVPPAEPIPLKLGRFLLTNNAVYKLSH